MPKQIAVVTGGAKGIGWATVEAFAKAGIVPILFDRDQQSIERATTELKDRGIEHHTELVDITSETAVNQAFAIIMQRYGKLDILVNNAGIAIRHPTADLSLNDWNKVVDINLNAVFLCCRAASRVMIGAGKGAIVNVSSIMGLSGGGLYPNISYQTTKGALINLTRALAVEWASNGIRVNAVAPTWVSTDLTQGLISDPQLYQRMLDMTPMRRLAQPADVADAILFLASDSAKMVTGHTLPVDGGFLAQ